MGKTSKEIECLAKLHAMTSCLGEIMGFLHAERLIQDVEIKDIRSSSNYPKSVQAILSGLQKAEKIQLLEYEWVLLPVERIKLTIVTDRDQKEFTYNV